MRVPLVTKRPVQLYALVRAAVAVGIAQKPDVRNAPRDDAIPVWIDSGRDIQPIGEGGDFVVPAIAGGVLENLDRVASVAIGKPFSLRLKFASPE